MTESNLIDQADDLAPGSWTKLQTENGFFDVALTRAEHDAIVQQSGGASFWGTGGPSKVFEAWNSGAYDAAENRMFFMGGGHADYGGNEVYSFDFDTLEWTRVSEPDPLTKSDGLDSNGNPLFIPEDGPLSPHTYEGLTWNPVTETLWLTNTVTGFSSTLSSPNRPPDEAVWEFDPATGEWTKHEVASANNRGSSVFLEETGQILAIENSNRGTFDPTLIDADGGATHGEATEFDPVSGMGTGRIEGNLFTNPVTGQVYQSRKEGIFQLDFVKDSDGNIIDFVDTKIEGSPGSLHQAAFDFADSDGNFYIWNGGREVIRWTPGDEDDPTDDSFETLFNLGGDAPGGGGGGKVFDKFVYLEEAEAFAGIQTADGDGGGIWLFKPGDNPANIDQLDVGAISLDPATSGVINIHVAGGDLDKNGDGRVEIAYRKAGESAWQEAQDLLRQDSGDFAGSILGLDAGTTFEVKVSAQDPDGLVDSADAARIITAETDSLPDAAAAGGANEIRVASVAELQAAIDAATGGEVIVLEAGVHTGTLDIRSSGTADAPITIRGVADGESVIDAGGAGKALRIEGDHLRIEDLSIQNAYTGIALRDGRGDHVDDLVIQGNKITGVTEGIDGNEGHRDIRILDNLLIGVAGAITPEELGPMLDRIFGGLPASEVLTAHVLGQRAAREIRQFLVNPVEGGKERAVERPALCRAPERDVGLDLVLRKRGIGGQQIGAEPGLAVLAHPRLLRPDIAQDLVLGHLQRAAIGQAAVEHQTGVERAADIAPDKVAVVDQRIDLCHHTRTCVGQLGMARPRRGLDVGIEKGIARRQLQCHDPRAQRRGEERDQRTRFDAFKLARQPVLDRALQPPGVVEPLEPRLPARGAGLGQHVAGQIGAIGDALAAHHRHGVTHPQRRDQPRDVTLAPGAGGDGCEGKGHKEGQKGAEGGVAGGQVRAPVAVDRAGRGWLG